MVSGVETLYFSRIRRDTRARNGMATFIIQWHNCTLSGFKFEESLGQSMH